MVMWAMTGVRVKYVGWVEGLMKKGCRGWRVVRDAGLGDCRM